MLNMRGILLPVLASILILTGLGFVDAFAQNNGNGNSNGQGQSNSINAQVDSNTAAIDQEIQDRQAADNNLQVQVDSLIFSQTCNDRLIHSLI